jgi:N-sulfoglucosamine sulfohydrolase
MKAAGYFTGIRGKVPHSTPYSPYPGWDVILDTLPDGTARASEESRVLLRLDQARHRGGKASRQAVLFQPQHLRSPQAVLQRRRQTRGEQAQPRLHRRRSAGARLSSSTIPRSARNSPLYYSSVRRADDSLGGHFRALRESGEDERTLIIFLSDHGMPLPFAKTQLYFHSTRTPLDGPLAGRHETRRRRRPAPRLRRRSVAHAARHRRRPAPARHGRPQLRARSCAARRRPAATTSSPSTTRIPAAIRHPMRTIITRDYAYLFNPWSNGTRVMATATRGTVTYRRMQALAKTDPAVAARLDLFEHRVPEELYHYAADPDARQNLIASPAHRAERDALIALLEAWMVRTRDPMLAVFRDPPRSRRPRSVHEQEASARKAGNPRKTKGGGKKKAGKAGD